MKFDPQKYLKAFASAVVAGLGSAQVALVDNVITSQEYVSIAVVVVVAFSAVWAVPNKGA